MHAALWRLSRLLEPDRTALVHWLLERNSMTSTKQKAGGTRLLYLDNVRYLLILLVVLFHSACSYSDVVPFWPFHDSVKSHLADIVIMFLNVFMMPILFFIAGYFTLPSLQKEGACRFLVSKFKRLGIPWLVITVFLLPVLDYIHYARRSLTSGLSVMGYLDYWMRSIAKIAEFRIGFMSMTEYLPMIEHYYQRYMWFLSLLFLFFVVFCLLYQIRHAWLKSSARPADSIAMSERRVTATLLVFGFLVSIAYFWVYRSLSPPRGWFTLGNLIQFQPSELVLYVGYFALGIYAFANKWLGNAETLGNLRIWVPACFLLSGGMVLVGRSLFRSLEPSLGLYLAFAFFYSFLGLSFLVVLTSISVKYWNHPSRVNESWASNSYNIYLVHYPFVMLLPLLVSGWTGGPVLVRWGAVFLASALSSYGVSEYGIKRFPRLMVLGLVAVNVLMVVFTLLEPRVLSSTLHSGM